MIVDRPADYRVGRVDSLKTFVHASITVAAAVGVNIAPGRRLIAPEGNYDVVVYIASGPTTSSTGVSE